MKPAEVRAAGRLAGLALRGGTAMVRDIHAALGHRVLAAVGPVGAPVGLLTRTTTRAVYQAVGAALWLGGTAAGVVMASRVTGPPRPASPRALAAIGFLNGAYGDLLDRRFGELAQPMSIRLSGDPVPVEPDALAAAFPAASGRVAVFVHGLVNTEQAWTYRSVARHGAPGVSYGSLLQRDLGITPVLLRYNTGLRISHNGRLLDALLSDLAAHWPVPVEELVLVGHSMGALVIRSALAQASGRWPGVARATVGLGAPHLGAPLERGAALATRLLSGLDETRPVADALARRSVGIKDLRHGNLLDADWSGYDPDDPVNRRGLVPAHPGVRHYVVLSTVLPAGAPGNHLLGDLMISPASACGAGAGPLGPALPTEQVHRVVGLHHLDLLNHPLVYTRLRGWLGQG